MAAFARDKVASVLETLGWTYSRFDVRWSATTLGLCFEIENLSSDGKPYRGIICKYVRIAVGVRGVDIQVNGIQINLLLSRGELYVVSKTDASSGPPKVIKTSASLFSTLISRLIGRIGHYFLGRSNIVVEDATLRIESAQNGRSFAAICSFDKFSLGGNPTEWSSTSINSSLLNFRIVWEDDPMAFAFLKQETPKKKLSGKKVLREVDLNVTVTINREFTIVKTFIHITNGLRIMFGRAQMLDLLSLANGGGLPNAWGLDRHPRAIWNRALETIKARRSVVRDDKIRKLLERLKAERLAANDFDEFFEIANRIVHGDVLATSSELDSKSTNGVNETTSTEKVLLATLRCPDPIEFIVDTEPASSVVVSLDSCLDIEANSDGIATAIIKGLMVRLPGALDLRMDEIMAGGSSKHGLQNLDVQNVVLNGEDVFLLRLDSFSVKGHPENRNKSIALGDMIVFEEWPTFWKGYLGYKLLIDHVSSPFAEMPPIQVSLPSDMSASSAVDIDSFDVAFSMRSFLLFQEQSATSKGGFGFQGIKIQARSDGTSLDSTVQYSGPSNKVPLGGDPALRVRFRRDEGIPNIDIACKNAEFGVNVPLFLFWLKIKGPPPALPPVDAPIRSILPLDTQDHSVNIKWESCTLHIGDEIAMNISMGMKSQRRQAFFDSSTIDMALIRSSSSSSATDEYFDAQSLAFDGTHIVEIITHAFELHALGKRLFKSPRAKFSIIEGVEVGGTRVELHCTEGRPAVYMETIEPIKGVLEMYTRLNPYPVPQPIIPLEFRYFPEIVVRLSGTEVLLGPLPGARMTWYGLDFDLKAKGGGNFPALETLILNLRGSALEWNLLPRNRGASVSSPQPRWLTLMSMPRTVPSQNVLSVRAMFGSFERQTITCEVFPGFVSVPFVALKQILEVREAITTFFEELQRKPSIDDFFHDDQSEVEVLEIMDVHNEASIVESVMYMNANEAQVVSQQAVENVDIRVTMNGEFSVTLIDVIEFVFSQLDIVSASVPDDNHKRETVVDASWRFGISEKSVLSDVSVRALIEEHLHGELRHEKVVDIHFYKPITLEFDRASIGPINTLLKLLESKTTKKDDLKETTAVAVQEEAIPTITARSHNTFRLSLSLAGVTSTIYRTCKRTKRIQRVFFTTVENIKISALKKRSQSRLELACSLAVTCMDTIQVLDPTRIVIVLRANGQEEVLASVSRPKLDIDFRAVDSVNFTVTQSVMEALAITKAITEKSKVIEDFSEQYEEASELELTQADVAPKNVQKRRRAQIEDEDIIFSDHQSGYYVLNDSGTPLYGRLVHSDGVSFSTSRSERDLYSCTGWVKVCNATGLDWHRCHATLNPLSLSIADNGHGQSIGALSLIDPFTRRFATVTMDGDSDSEKSSLGDATSTIIRMSAALFFPSTDPVKTKEAKYVKSFQITVEPPQAALAHTGGNRPHTRKFRFICKDTTTKLRFLYYLARARAAIDAAAKEIDQLKGTGMSCERVVIEGAGRCCVRGAVGRETDLLDTPGTGPETLNCFVELEGSLLSLFSRSVPRRGVDPVPPADMVYESNPMIATEYLRTHHFLGVLDLFHALTVYREAEDDGFYIEFSRAPERVKLTFESPAITRYWEGAIAEAITMCFIVKRHFEDVSKNKEFVLGPSLLPAEFSLAPGAYFHVEDRLQAVIIGPEDKLVTSEAGSINTSFRPEILVGMKRHVVREDMPSLTVASKFRETTSETEEDEFKDHQLVRRLQSRCTLLNRSSSTLKLELGRLLFRERVCLKQRLLYYGVRNEGLEERTYSWVLEEVNTIIDQRLNQAFQPGETRWFKLSDKSFEPSEVMLRPVANTSGEEFFCTLLGWLTWDDSELIAAFPSIHPQQTISLPNSWLDGLRCSPILRLEYDGKIEEVPLGMPSEPNTSTLSTHIEFRVLVASDMPSKVVTWTKFIADSQVHLVVDDLLTIENRLAGEIAIGSTILEADGGISRDCAHLLHVGDFARSLCARPFHVLTQEFSFGLAIEDPKPARLENVILGDDEHHLEAKRRAEFGNGNSATVRFYAGLIHSLKSDADLEQLRLQNLDDEGEETWWEEHFHARARAQLPLRIVIEARTRVCNQSGFDLFLRRRIAFAQTVLLRNGATGFLTEDDSVLEMSLVSKDGTPVRWSANTFSCRVGVSGVVEASGMLPTQCFKFAVDVTAVGAETLVTICPFYTILSTHSLPLEFMQVGTNKIIPLPRNELYSFHPIDIDANGVVDDSELFLRIRLNIVGRPSHFSAPFRLDVVQETLVICDRDTTIDPDPHIVDPTNSAIVSPDTIELARLGLERASPDSTSVGVCISTKGAGVQISFVPASEARLALRYKFINATKAEIMSIREQKAREDQLPFIVHPGQTVSYIFRSQVTWIDMKLRRYRNMKPVEVDVSNVGWMHELPDGYTLEVVETQAGRCVVLFDPV